MNIRKIEKEMIDDSFVQEIDDKITVLSDDVVKNKAEVTQHLAQNTAHVPYANDTGTANAKNVSIPDVTSLFEGMALAFKNTVQNTGAVTINVNGYGAKAIVKSNGNPLVSGNLKANSIYTVRYNGTNFILQGEGGEYGTATPADVLVGKTIGTEEGIKLGTLSPGKKQASGSGTASSSSFTVAGLDFRPSKVIASQLRDGINVNTYILSSANDFYSSKSGQKSNVVLANDATSPFIGYTTSPVSTINSNGFTLGATFLGAQFVWWAFE